MVEHLLAKERVASSNLVFRSKEIGVPQKLRFAAECGDVAKWLRRGSAKPLFTGSNPVVASNFRYGIDFVRRSSNKNC